ncbi:hypothetical protein J7K52_06360 [Candidatus Bathyarchaeota archaeon]|nr:hypothetical protein [Candidatus Bathyarchaeota archaeon]
MDISVKLMPCILSYIWLYNSTNGNLLTVSLYHTSINTSNILLFVESGVSGSIFPFYFLRAAIFVSIICFTFKPDSLCHKEKWFLELPEKYFRTQKSNTATLGLTRRRPVIFKRP